MTTLNGKTVWLTGASSGIGEALANELAARGAHLVITARRKDVLSEQAERLNAAGGKVKAYPGDVTDCAHMCAIAKELGRIDVLLANAGTSVPTEVEGFESSQCSWLMDINYTGVLNCIQAVLPDMLDRKSGHIVGVSSLTGYRGLPTAAGYAATKAALINFLESFRFDLRQYGIDVSVVNPGFVKTPLTDKNPFEMPFLIEAPKAAKIIVDGIEQKKWEIHFPWQLSWILKFMRVIPYPLYDWLVRKKVY